jgi:hypothetical protein
MKNISLWKLWICIIVLIGTQRILTIEISTTTLKGLTVADIRTQMGAQGSKKEYFSRFVTSVSIILENFSSYKFCGVSLIAMLQANDLD